MKWIKPSKLEWYCFLFPMPLIALALNFILYESRLWTDYRLWLFSIPIMFFLGFLSWYSHVLYGHWVIKRFPSLSQTRQRIFWKSLVIILVMSPGVALIFLLYDAFHLFGYQLETVHLLKGLLVGLCVNLIFQTLYEADYAFSKLKESAAEKESMEELSVASEFDLLKGQVNPHFLFNCFNTLSSLISVDKQKAEAFLNELSKVYRYLLRNNEEGVTTVENEIKFIRSYYKLLQTRHGEAVQLNLQVDKEYEQYLLPSLTLQLLMENVVKHNVLSKNKPLIIDIFTTEGKKLVVSNNMQRRSVKAPSNKVGLDNIKAKYDLLKKPGFRVLEDEKNFTVVLPLIWKGPAAFGNAG